MVLEDLMLACVVGGRINFNDPSRIIMKCSSLAHPLMVFLWWVLHLNGINLATTKNFFIAFSEKSKDTKA